MRKIKPTEFPKDPVVASPAVLGAAVRAVRTGAGLRLQDAADLLGVAKQTLQDLETGKPGISLGRAIEIAAGLGATLLVVPSGHAEQARRLISESRL